MILRNLTDEDIEEIKMYWRNITKEIRRIFSPSAFRVMKNIDTRKYFAQFKMYGIWWRYGKKSYDSVDELDAKLMAAKEKIRRYILGEPSDVERAVIEILDEEEE